MSGLLPKLLAFHQCGIKFAMSIVCISLGQHNGGLILIFSWDVEVDILMWVYHWGMLCKGSNFWT